MDRHRNDSNWADVNCRPRQIRFFRCMRRFMGRASPSKKRICRRVSDMSAGARMRWFDSKIILLILQLMPKQPEGHPEVLQRRCSPLAVTAETTIESSSRTAPKNYTFQGYSAGQPRRLRISSRTNSTAIFVFKPTPNAVRLRPRHYRRRMRCRP